MNKKRVKVITLVLVFTFFFITNKKEIVYSENLSTKLEEVINKIDDEGTVDILEVAKSAYNLSYIDIDPIIRNYVKIVSNQDKMEYEELGYEIISQNCLPVTEKGIDLFAYVSSAEGMKLEILEGDNSFVVENDRLYLVGEAPAIAKVRLVNPYAISEPFYIYGTADRELHDFTYDYLLNLVNN